MIIIQFDLISGRVRINLAVDTLTGADQLRVITLQAAADIDEDHTCILATGLIADDNSIHTLINGAKAVNNGILQRGIKPTRAGPLIVLPTTGCEEEGAASRIEKKFDNKNITTLIENAKPGLNSQKMKLCIPSMKGFIVFSISDVLYCESESNYTSFFFVDGSKKLSSRSLSTYEVMLLDSNFIRVNKSQLVNIDYVKEYIKGNGGSVILENGSEIFVSRRKKEMLLERIRDVYKY